MAGVGLIQGDPGVLSLKITGPVLILLAILRLGVGVFRFFLSGKLAQKWTHMQRESLARRMRSRKSPVTADELQKYSYHAENGGQFFIVLSMLFFNSVSAIATIIYCFWLSVELTTIVAGVALILLVPFLIALKMLKDSVNRVFQSKQLMDRYFVSMIGNVPIMDTIDTQKIVDKNIEESSKFAKEMLKIDIIKGIKRNFPELIGICIVILLITQYRDLSGVSVSLLTTIVYLLVRLSQYLGSALFALGQAQFLYKSIDVNREIDLTSPQEERTQVLRSSAPQLSIAITGPRGEKFALTAPGLVQLSGVPGSGKTTLLRHILGYLENDPFHVSLNGMSCHLFVKDMAYLGGAPMIYPESMLNNILLFSDSKTSLDRADQEFVQTVFPDIRFESLMTMAPAQLSTGQLQRLSFLQLAFSKRRILMLDETFSSLGSEERHLLEALKRRLPESLIIFVSHNIEPGSLGRDVINLHRPTK
jgi:ABC-type transport system involved in cytochrome bd biosynthesis fused ATPase/permease subunit